MILNGVTLNEGLVWEGEFDSAVISQSVSYTILGNVVVQNMPLPTNKEIRIVAKGDGSFFMGSFTRSQVTAFKDLERSGSAIIFDYEGSLFNVVIKAGGVQMSPILAGTNQNSSDLYTGTLILIEV